MYTHTAKLLRLAPAALASLLLPPPPLLHLLLLLPLPPPPPPLHLLLLPLPLLLPLLLLLLLPLQLLEPAHGAACSTATHQPCRPPIPSIDINPVACKDSNAGFVVADFKSAAEQDVKKKDVEPLPATQLQ